MIRIILIICLLLGFETTIAQSINFLHDKWDFGTIAEDGGAVSHIFEFTNSGDKPIVITDVRTTCGCTTPEYSKRPITPNSKSSIEIKYDPLYRPGPIARDISIYTSADREPVVVKISGFVTPRQRSVQERFPYILGEGVRISSLYSFLSNINHNTPVQTQFEIINTSQSDKSITIGSGDVDLSEFLTLEYPKRLGAGESAIVHAVYDVASQSGFYGVVKDNLAVHIDGVRSSMEIVMRAYVVDDFGADAKKGVASGHFSKKFINFEAFNLKDRGLKRELSIENTGSETLHIRKLELPKGVVITTAQGLAPQGLSVAPGQILELVVTLNNNELELGPLLGYATFIVNDPAEPAVRIKIVGEVSM